jgi:hypothetical protein
MNVKIEIKLTNEDTKFSSSSMKRVKGDIKEVIREMLIESGFTLYALNPEQNKRALALTTLDESNVQYDIKQQTNYIHLTKKQFKTLTRQELENEIKILIQDCIDMQEQVNELHSLVAKRIQG